MVIRKTFFAVPFCAFVLFFSAALPAFSQNSNISIGTDQLKEKAILWVKGNGSNQGLLLPVVSNRSSFTSLNNGDDKGMMIFDLSDNKIYYWNGTAWTQGGADLNSITSAEIVNATIVDADIANVSAAKITTGILPVARGGTNITSVVPGAVAYGGTTDFAFTATGLPGQVLTSNGNSTPTWTDASASTVNGPGPVPAGGIMMWSGSPTEIPTGYALCDGNTYIDAGGGTRTTPDLRGRFVVGLDPAASATPANVTTGKEINYGAIGNRGGENLHTLSLDEMPIHTHTGSTAAGGDHTPTGSVSGGGGHTPSGTANLAGFHDHTGTISNAGDHDHSSSLVAGSGFGTANRLARVDAADGTFSFNTTVNGLHSHGLTINPSGDHGHSLSMSPVPDHGHSLTMNSVGSHSHALTIANTGSGQTNENRPPYFVLAYIMKKY